jgi:hypothetical protein
VETAFSGEKVNAPETRKIKEGNFFQYSGTDSLGEAEETSGCDCLFKGWQVEETEETVKKGST